MVRHLVLLTALGLAVAGAKSQSTVDHWESLVSAGDTWTYLTPTTTLPSNWSDLTFSAPGWSVGPGGLGYGDGDDATIVSTGPSLYIRRVFNVSDTALLASAIFHADYDDGFVAYLNGVEIARDNVDGSPPAWYTTANTYREAQLYSGGAAAAFALSESEVNSLIQNGSNVLAIQIHNQSAGSSDMSGLFWLSCGITAPGSFFAPLPSWFVEPFNSSNIPLIQIETGGTSIPSGDKIDATVRVTDQPSGLRNYLSGPYTYEGPCGVSLRGASSLWFNKKGYSLELRRADGSPDNFPLLGMPDEDDWVLHGPYSDKSLVRNALAYRLGQSMQSWAPGTRFCELLIDGDYKGIYLLTEKSVIDNNRIDLATLNPTDIGGDELTGGYLLQVDRDYGEPNQGWYSPAWPSNHFIVYEDPKGDEMPAVQRNYIRSYVNDFEASLQGSNWQDSALGYKNYADLTSFAEYFLHQELGNNVDAYRLSTFFYKKKDSKGGKLWMGPVWDYNIAYGNVDYCIMNLNTNGWAYNADDVCFTAMPFWWDRLMEDTSFQQKVRCRWDSLRAGSWSDESIMGAIDSMVLVLDEAAPRNFDRWNVLGTYLWPNAYIGNTWEEEIGYLKGWVGDRLDFMDVALPEYCPAPPAPPPPPPPPPSTGLEEVLPDALAVWPNPHYGTVQIRPKNPEALIWTLYDLQGREIESWRIQGSSSISLPSDLPDHLIYRCFDLDGGIIGSGLLIDQR